ncbi:DUF2945 domain-containing protein [Sphingobium phenoxybenzoativorans]|uniref:DUF2945 domain-containing protein n=1 Tax=Sphingobium phenoxybenzoativorans TaxID=1592790 RepID=UPI0008724441|nr:DUF2945 domain-containing protein [Sphingobium phenoxybenzoativorans]
MAKSLRQGTRVRWESHGGKAHGKVIRKLTGRTRIKGHQVSASRHNPEYLVETDEGKHAAHKAGALAKD